MREFSIFIFVLFLIYSRGDPNADVTREFGNYAFESSKG